MSLRDDNSPGMRVWATGERLGGLHLPTGDASSAKTNPLQPGGWRGFMSQNRIGLAMLRGRRDRSVEQVPRAWHLRAGPDGGLERNDAGQAGAHRALGRPGPAESGTPGRRGGGPRARAPASLAEIPGLRTRTARGTSRGRRGSRPTPFRSGQVQSTRAAWRAGNPTTAARPLGLARWLTGCRGCRLLAIVDLLSGAEVPVHATTGGVRTTDVRRRQIKCAPVAPKSKTKYVPLVHQQT